MNDASAAAASAAQPSRDVEDLPLALLAGIGRFKDWLIGEGSRDDDAGEMLTGIAEHLNELGVPVDRIATAIEALHSEYAGVGRFWSRDEGSTFRLLPHGQRREAVYQRSPFAHVNRTGEWLLIDLAETPDDQFPIVPDLKRGGYRHYLTVPVRFTNGAENGISFATRSPDGFSAQALQVLRAVMPTLASVTELRVVRKRLD
ncbi:MAG: adenylate/guanylate cyclase domain-containing protein, partial [Microvirga sp.]